MQEKIDHKLPRTFTDTDTGELRAKRYLHNRIARRFDRAEFDELAHWFGVMPEDLSGERHTDKILQFVLYMQRRGKIPQLIDRLEQLRPNENWHTE